MFDFLPAWLTPVSFVMLMIVVIVLLSVALLYFRNPTATKLGVRNMPRRPTQTALIVAGLTLSTVIIVAALSTGDTLDYSVQRYAVSAYGEIDEIIAPPLLTSLASLSIELDPDAEDATATDTTTAGDEAPALDLSGTGYDTLINLLTEGLPGITNQRFEELRAKTEAEPLIDGVAPSIVFPTIIRNTSTGQGEPLGFIFAVDSHYDQEFGLHSIDGEAVAMESLEPGVGNIFQSATQLFAMAAAAAGNLGLDLQLSDAAVAIAAVGSLASGDLSEEQANDFLSSLLGEDAPQLPAGSLGLIQGLLPQSETSVDGSGSAESGAASSEAAGAEAGAPAAGAAAIPLLESLNIPDATELASALNLNTLRSEIDRVLGQFGLQLRQGDVYLNRLGAERLDAHVGDVLEIFLGPIPLPYRVKGIVDEAGPMGTLTPVVMMRLDEAQKLLSPVMPGQVNAILVSNLGDAVDGLQYTDEVSERLRVLSLDDEGLQAVAAILQRPAVQRVIAAEATDTAEMMPDSGGAAYILSLFGDIANVAMPSATQIRALPAVLENQDMDALRSTLGSMADRSWLVNLPFSEQDSADLNDAIDAMTAMDVLDPLNKRTVVALSGVAGTTFSTVFSIFGIFSIMAGVLLIFMIFVMLAAERRSEMGMARAIGMQRNHLVQMFITEGVLYDLVAALVGLVLGLGVSYLMIDFLSALFNDVSGQFSGQELFFRFQFHVTTPSVIIAYCMGVLFTFVIVTFSAYRVSRLNIVAAIRDIPDADNASLRPLWQKIGRAVVGPLLLAGGIYVIWWGMDDQGLTAILTGVTLTLVGLAFVANWLLDTRHVRGEIRSRLIYTAVGLGMILTWGVPWARVIGDGSALFEGNPIWVPLTFALGGPMLILGAILVVMFNADTWVWAVNRLLGGIGALTPVLRTAIAYPLSSRFRTGMAMTMFAMVITTVVIMSIVIQATQTLVEPDIERSAGFDIQLNTTLLSFFDPVSDLAVEIPKRLPEVADDVAQVGRFGLEYVELRESTDPYWTRKSVSGLSAGFVQQMAEIYPLRMRAEGFADDAAIWQALQERDDVALVTSNLLPGAFTIEEGDQPGPMGNPAVELDEAPAEGNGDLAWGPFWLANVDENSDTLPADTTIEIRNDAGEMRTVQVIGMLEAGSTLASSDILVNETLLTSLGIEPGDASWYVAVKEGVDVRETAQALEAAFLSSGLDASVMADSFAQGQQITRGILQLFQGFMALGLFVGIAALGVISSRTVVERRQQIGMLRAIGYQPGMVALSFVLEASFIAFVGIAIGTATGVILGRNMLGAFFELINPGAFTMPWLEIGGILVLAYVFSLLTTILPAAQASRIYPAEALRYE